MKRLPVTILLVTGTAVLGDDGVLLVVASPADRTWAIPVDTAPLNDEERTNITEVGVSIVLEIYNGVKHARMLEERPTFMIISLVEYLRTTLQNNVPFAFGNVLGKYASPRFRLKSCERY